MATDDGDWPVKDIIYVCIVGVVMLAAVFEWILWLASFLYCLIKAYQKAENTSTRVLAVTIMVAFTILRIIFLPVMIVTLPLPSAITRYFPRSAVEFLQWFAFWTFAGLLIVPWLMCVYQLVTHSIGRTKKIKYILDEIGAPKVVVVMPCYKEIPDILLRTVDSLVDCDYPSACLHIFLSFDGDQEDELYLNTIQKLGVPLFRRSGFPTSIDVTYRDTRITVSRFPHGGKRHCQKKTFKLIDKIYSEYLKVHDNLFVLFIDSDCILDKVCIQNFMYEMELKPGSKGNMLAMTGIITATTEKNTLLTLLQDMEYIHGQLFERSVESGCGAVTCLPGALTILRFSAFRKLAKYYFADKTEQCDDLFDYGKCHLGEDRWLTHLFMIASEKRYQIGLATNSFLKTESVQTYKSLLKQRRRWFLGFITNEACMLTDIRLWKRYPMLCIVRFSQNTIRTTALLFFIMVISLLSTAETIEDLPVGFIAVSLGLNWALMIYFALLLGRYKIILYPVLFIVGPFLNWLYMVYGIFTAGQRTWGGPRADAGQADAQTSPQAAIEHAEATGDDLNIVPETFRPALGSRRLGRSLTLPRVNFQPSDHLAGRFRSTAKASEPWPLDDQSEASFNLLVRGRPRSSTIHNVPFASRNSIDSITSSATESVMFPRRAESFFFGLEDGINGVARPSRAHPPSAYSHGAYFDGRRGESRLSSSTLGLPGAHRLSKSWTMSNEELKTTSLSHRDVPLESIGVALTTDIPLADLSKSKMSKKSGTDNAAADNPFDPYAYSRSSSYDKYPHNPFSSANASESKLSQYSSKSEDSVHESALELPMLRPGGAVSTSAAAVVTATTKDVTHPTVRIVSNDSGNSQNGDSREGQTQLGPQATVALKQDKVSFVYSGGKRSAPPSSYHPIPGEGPASLSLQARDRPKTPSVHGSESSTTPSSIAKGKKLHKRRRPSVS